MEDTLIIIFLAIILYLLFFRTSEKFINKIIAPLYPVSSSLQTYSASLNTFVAAYLAAGVTNQPALEASINQLVNASNTLFMGFDRQKPSPGALANIINAYQLVSKNMSKAALPPSVTNSFATLGKALSF